jgi:hypothetical protein
VLGGELAASGDDLELGVAGREAEVEVTQPFARAIDLSGERAHVIVRFEPSRAVVCRRLVPEASARAASSTLGVAQSRAASTPLGFR